MISPRFKQHIHGWQTFVTLSKPQRKQFIERLSVSQVKDLEELFYNILKGNVQVDQSTLVQLRKHKSKVKLIAQKRVALKKREKLHKLVTALPW